MEGFTVICTPGRIYEDMSALEAAQNYTRNAIKGFDELIGFDPTYAKKKVWHEERMMDQVEVPDHNDTIGNKGEFELMLSLFARQPVLSVGDVEGKFTSSSYLFGPDMGLGGDLYSPDIDVIEISGENRVEEAAFAIANFYGEVMGWQTYLFGEILEDKQVAVPTSQRFGNEIVFTNPLLLRKIASEKLGHSLVNLCFDL